MPISFQIPYELLNEPRVKRLKKRMKLNGIGALFVTYQCLRKGNGLFPLDSIMAEAEGDKVMERQLKRLLTQFDLFIIEDGMVRIRDGLNLSSFLRKESIAKKVRQMEELQSRDYSDLLFPEESKAADLEEASRLKKEIDRQCQSNFKKEWG